MEAARRQTMKIAVAQCFFSCGPVRRCEVKFNAWQSLVTVATCTKEHKQTIRNGGLLLWQITYLIKRKDAPTSVTGSVLFFFSTNYDSSREANLKFMFSPIEALLGNKLSVVAVKVHFTDLSFVRKSSTILTDQNSVIVNWKYSNIKGFSVSHTTLSFNADFYICLLC